MKMKLTTRVLAILAVAVALLGSVGSVSAQSYEVRQDTIIKEVVTEEEVVTANQGDIKLYFRINSYKVEPNFSENAEQLALLDSIMSKRDVTVGLDSMVLVATASVDGNEEFNRKLAENRANSVKAFLAERYPQLSDMPFKATFFPEDWAGLRRLVKEDLNVPYRTEVLEVIDDTKRAADNKEWLLKTMYDRKPWNYLVANILPKLRYGASVLFYYNVDVLRRIAYEEEVIETKIEIPQQDTVIIAPVTPAPEREPFVFAIKTNLLYDVALSPNLELEIPIGDRFSISAEYIFPWWSNNKSNYTQRANIGHAAITYWLGDREGREKLTGWNIGLFGGYGHYDLQIFDPKGIQGELINTGISVGYAHSIAKNLHLHYQLGFGYMSSDYRDYTKMWDTRFGDVKVFDYPWEVKRQTWVGPTQAEISLVWMINL